MRAVDTNVLVRYLTGDDPAQAEQARAVVARGSAFVPRTVLLETEWVLRAVYDVPPERIIAALRAFAGLPEVIVEDAALVATALHWADRGVDLADALHVAAAVGCESFLTFDQRLVRAGARLGATPVSLP